MDELIKLQPSFEIKVNVWGRANEITIDDVIRRHDWYGTADVNVVVDGVIADGVTPVVSLEFRRYRLQYNGSWRGAGVEYDTIRVYANHIDVVLNKTLEWIAEHPEYTEDRPPEDIIAAFHERCKTEEWEKR